MSTCNKNKIVLITLHKNCYVTHKQLPITLHQVYDFVSVSSLIEIKIRKEKTNSVNEQQKRNFR